MATVQNKMGVQFQEYENFTVHHCGTCGIPYAFPLRFEHRLRETHSSFYCPNGHGHHYPEGSKTHDQIELERLKRELEVSQQNEKFFNSAWQKKVDENKKLNRDIKRINKRVTNGVCPCCNRTFQDLAAHMKTKHPEEVKKTIKP